MAFSRTWAFPPVIALPGRLPVADQTVYVDFDAATNGTGTSGSPYNRLIGTSSGDSGALPFGTRVMCKGTLRSSTANFGQLKVAGLTLKPLVYVGNDPAWMTGGQPATIDGSIPLTTSACASQAEARGNPNFASMRKATLSSGNDPDDYLHCAYGGVDRDMRWLAGFPQLANDSAFDYNLFPSCNSVADALWYPGISEGATAGSDGQSRPRLNLAAANTAMGLSAGTLEAALDTDCVPVIMMRMYPNVWFTARAGRCDIDGTLNSAGAYLTAIDGQRISGSNVTPQTAGYYKFRILNVAKAIDRAGTYAMNPAAGWLVEWPYASEQLYRAQGKSGLEFAANNIMLHGFKICGMSTSRTVTDATGAGGGTSLTAAAGVDLNTIYRQRLFFPAFGSVNAFDKSRQQYFDATGGKHTYFNTYKRQAVGSALAASDRMIVKFNDFDQIHGSNIRSIGSPRINLLVGGNRITNCNDIHGNGITLYSNKYNVIIEYNYINNVGRPLTSETNGTIDGALGAMSTIVRYNTFIASGDGTLAACRFQSLPADAGIVLTGNKFYGPTGTVALANTALAPSPANGPWNDNILVGGTSGTEIAALVAAGTGNIIVTAASAEGIAYLAAWQSAGLDSTYAPQGAGHLAGGWDGTS